MHPTSVGSRLNCSGWISPYLTFHTCIRTTQLYCRDCTPLPPLSPLLFSGSNLRVLDAAGGKELLLDDCLRVEMSAALASLVVDARQRVMGRWEGMVRRAGLPGRMREGWSGRFNGQTLLDAIQPLLEQRVLPLKAPVVKRAKKSDSQARPAPQARASPRRKRKHMARYKRYW